MRLLLDTAVFIFSIESPDRLSKRVVQMLGDPGNIRELSTVSLIEIAIKTNLGKLSISADTARQAIVDLDIRILPFTADHAFRFYELPALHSDPFDRQIIAQALFEEIPVVTSDRKFEEYRGLGIVW